MARGRTSWYLSYARSVNLIPRSPQAFKELVLTVGKSTVIWKFIIRFDGRRHARSNKLFCRFNSTLLLIRSKLTKKTKKRINYQNLVQLNHCSYYGSTRRVIFSRFEARSRCGCLLMTSRGILDRKTRTRKCFNDQKLLLIEITSDGVCVVLRVCGLLQHWWLDVRSPKYVSKICSTRIH